MHKVRWITLFAAITCCTSPKEASTEAVSNLGDIDHSFSIADAARPFFDEGLLLLHSFEYEDAREAFRLAQAQDSTEIMIYWGLAMTHYKALWGLQDLEAGRAIITEWEDMHQEETMQSELEAEFWKGVKLLYGDGELRERNDAYVAHMATLYEENPQNLEVAAFYALGLMWSDYSDRDALKKSAEVAAGVIKENPNHPGALHYMIHANDDPEYAEYAINAADAYAGVAPDAAHALHMPSHIYVALGMWNEVVSSNTASYGASIRRVERKGLHGKDRGYHSMAWLHYGLLQQGRYDEAAELLREKVSYFEAGEGSDGYMINMQNQQRIESGKWPTDISVQHVDDSKLGLERKSQLHFFRGLLAFDQNNIEAIQAEIDTLGNQIASAKLLIGDEGFALCSAGPTRYAPTQNGIDKANIILNQMKILIAQLKGDETEMDSLFKETTQMEQDAGYDPGPPFIAYPSFEHYGDWLLTKGRYEEALIQFDRSLENRVNRSNALRGKLQALKALGRDEEANAVQNILDQFVTSST